VKGNIDTDTSVKHENSPPLTQKSQLINIKFSFITRLNKIHESTISSKPIIQYIVLYHFTNEEDAAAMIKFYGAMKERTKGYVLDIKTGL